ncbi:c-type cytochrome [Rhodoblastus acidophilus]|jgi:cytochrome c|uniref:C-type cytochrome n=1 Tax=Rhodoblastus acidophilus TaxID=1074 RepID=A0A6N8DQB8_RHOAC|nr:cytochrome c family protein [Rhodoblastus acidophilus]MCW2275866.1 cytochrome c [Rhodoblastus acidophilus]MTV32488.1 c-type cytochrome [Rhodoblastus acidophilus]
MKIYTIVTFAAFGLFANGAWAGVGDAGDPAAGEKIFQKCHACHNIGPDAKNAVAPVLNGISGRHSGAYPGYAYSDANKNSGITWDEATFKDYIAAPQKKIPGTKMTFPGLPNEKDRDDIWAFLIQYNADGAKK